MQEFHRD
jgi:hypothetical protein